MKQRNITIDFIRFIAALMVICLHSDFGELHTNIINIIKIGSRWAVPFFFMTTGVFLFKKESELTNFPEKKIKNLISIQIISSVIFIIIKFLNNENLKFGLVNILNGTYYHLWYIGSSILGLISIWYIYKIGLNNRLILISITILAVTLLTDGYDIIINKNIKYMPFLLSIPFIIIGRIISKKEIKINKLFLLFLIIISFSLQYVENYYLLFFSNEYESYRLFLGTIIFTILLYILINKIKLRGKKTEYIALLGRKYSLFIYLYHPIFLILLSIIIEQNSPLNKFLNIGLQPIIILSLTILLAKTLETYFPKFYNILNGNIKL